MLRKTNLQSTARLTQKKFQTTMTSNYSGGKIPFLLLSRSGNEWMVGDEKYPKGLLKANVGANLLIPPSTGWKYLNNQTKVFEEDLQLRCSSPTVSSSCSVTVSLSGRAKEFQGGCEGMYEDSGLRSAGRKVNQFQYDPLLHHFIGGN